MKRFAILLVCCWSVVLGQVTDFSNTHFLHADSIAERYAAHPLADLKTLADKLTHSLPTEQEKFRAIYKWVCLNVTADYKLVVLNQRNRTTLAGPALEQWTKDFNRLVFNTLRDEQKTVCTGYAYLIRELSFHAGLHCTIVNGHAKHAGVNQNALGPVNHSWNEIRLNGKWYMCDATWSAGVFNLDKDIFVKKYDDRYFLMEPSLFFQNHAADGKGSMVRRE